MVLSFWCFISNAPGFSRNIFIDILTTSRHFPGPHAPHHRGLRLPVSQEQKTLELLQHSVSIFWFLTYGRGVHNK